MRVEFESNGIDELEMMGMRPHWQDIDALLFLSYHFCLYRANEAENGDNSRHRAARDKERTNERASEAKKKNKNEITKFKYRI